MPAIKGASAASMMRHATSPPLAPSVVRSTTTTIFYTDERAITVNKAKKKETKGRPTKDPYRALLVCCLLWRYAQVSFVKDRQRERQKKNMPNAQAEALKAAGNAAFKSGKYADAIAQYQKATALDDTVPAYWSNMAACYEKLSDYEHMADAARSCIKADRSFIKGYFRLAVALKALNELDDCIKTLESGLAISASNADLKKMKKEVLELQRAEQVANYTSTAQAQFSAGDIAAAVKTIEAATRLDAGNPDLEALQAKVMPHWRKMEAKRKAALSGPELHKEKGDELYKNASFEAAIVEYTKCLEALEKTGKATTDLALRAYSNRAACYKQISHFDGTIADCTAVLEVDPANVKALIRRAQAFEGVERYRFALQDVKTVLAMPFSQVGKANFDLCNGMQHRLQRTVNQLKKMSSS